MLGGVSYPDKMPLQNIEVFKLGSTEWQLCNLNLPIPLRALSSVSLPEGILLLGGYDSYGSLRRECYKIVGSKEIKTLAQMPFVSQHLACVSTPTFEEVYVLNEKQICIYNTKKNYWYTSSQISPHAAEGAALVQF